MKSDYYETIAGSLNWVRVGLTSEGLAKRAVYNGYTICSHDPFYAHAAPYREQHFNTDWFFSIVSNLKFDSVAEVLEYIDGTKVLP